MKKALIVGINNYPVAPLNGCVNDAMKMAHLLEANEDLSANFSVNLRPNVARRHVLKELIADLFSGKSDTALLYFSGHGLVNELGGYLVTPDHQRYDEGISMNDILQLANQSDATHKIIILDCCHSGAIAHPSLSHSHSGFIKEGTTILTASRSEETAAEINGSGIFTNLLAEALNGGAADVNGHITPGSVYAYIDQALGPWEQRPVFKTNVSGFTTLRRVAARISIADLKQITTFFPYPSAQYSLNPSYEPTNSPEVEPVRVMPYAAAVQVSVFKALQQMQIAGLIEPVGAPHMYWAAMESKSCRLTPLGAHYWRLVEQKKI